jgi:hypothetical protein
MKTVKFEKITFCGDDTYRCDCPMFSKCDHSGTYVLASEANELLLENGHMAKAICNYQERIKVLEEAIKKHRLNVWGDGEVKHPEDDNLYADLEVKG